MLISRDTTLQLIKDQYSYLTSEFGIERIGLFGSVAKGNVNGESDIDIVVKLKKPLGFKFMELVDYLEKLFHAKVDVLTEDGLDNIRIKTISDEIKRNIVYV